MVDMSAVILAVFSAVSGGLANLFARRLVSVSQTRNMLSFNFALMAGMLLPATPWFFHLNLNTKGLILLAGAISLDGLANYGYFRSFERMDAVTASGLLAVSPLFALALTPLFLYQGSNPGSGQILAVGLFTFGIIMILVGLRKYSVSQKSFPTKEFVFPLGTAFLFSISMFFVKDLFLGNFLNPFTYYFLRAVVISVVSWVLIKPDLGWINGFNLLLTAGRLIFVIGQWLFLLTALKTGHPAVIKAIADLSPLVVVVFSWSVLRERPSFLQVAGMIMILAGGSVLAFYRN
ncbi:predicted membrane protein [Bellilinea caldifistulae]|nr:predicted membrane protein [Bellilinea caldifistulae]